MPLLQPGGPRDLSARALDRRRAAAARERLRVKKVHAVCELTGDGYGYGLDVFPDGFGHGGDMLGYVARMRAGTEAVYREVAPLVGSGARG